MSEEKYEFASPEWLEAISKINDQVVAEAKEAGELTDDVTFSMCEVYTDVPAEVNPADRVAWCMRVEGGAASFVLEEADDVQIKVVSDWELASSLGRIEYDMLAPPPEVQAKMAAAHGSGKMSMTINSVPNAPASFMGAHNRIARITK